MCNNQDLNRGRKLPIHQSEREPLQQKSARAVNASRKTLRCLEINLTARSTSRQIAKRPARCGAVRSLVNGSVKAFHERASQIRALLLRKRERLLKQIKSLLRHALIIPRPSAAFGNTSRVRKGGFQCTPQRRKPALLPRAIQNRRGWRRGCSRLKYS
jgi:hypothetical protein